VRSNEISNEGRTINWVFNNKPTQEVGKEAVRKDWAETIRSLVEEAVMCGLTSYFSKGVGVCGTKVQERLTLGN